MQLIPSIDIQNAKCVRLYQGDFAKVTEYDFSPLEVAKKYQAQGATALHVVDLEGAKQGTPMALSSIAAITKATSLTIQVGGGIRTESQITHYKALGANHIVIGSVAVTQPILVRRWLEQFSKDLILALDVKCNDKGEPFVFTQGWQDYSQRSLWAVLEQYEKSNLQTVLCTDINKDGALLGPNFALYESAKARYPHLYWQASGGIHTLDDLKVLKELALESVIIGRALYEHKFTLQEALRVTESC